MEQEIGVPSDFINTVFKKGARINLNFETYTMLSLLGAGGLGMVVKARKQTGELVALKFLYDTHDKTHDDAYERFKQEIKATKMVGDICDACVRVYECGRYDAVETYGNIPFFCMEYVPGLSLEDFILIKEKPFTPQEIYVIVRQIATALEGIHDKGIVHRDIKPSNILFHDARRILKVTDFGISRDLAAKTGVTTAMPDGRPVILGTLNYLSRYYFDTIEVKEHEIIESDTGKYFRKESGEQVSQNSDGLYYCAYKGKKLDISVLATNILYELTTGINPLSGQSFPSLLNDIMSGIKFDLKSFYKEHPSRFHPAIHKKPAFISHLDAIIRKGCAPDRRYCYESVGQLIADLNKAIKASFRTVPNREQTEEILASLLGKTLVDEYEYVLRRLERAISSGKIIEDKKNPTRIALLYKLKQTDRLMACIDQLHSTTNLLLDKAHDDRKQLYFFLHMWEHLERYGIEAPYRRNSKKLKDLLNSLEGEESAL